MPLDSENISSGEDGYAGGRDCILPVSTSPANAVFVMAADPIFSLEERLDGPEVRVLKLRKVAEKLEGCISFVLGKEQHCHCRDRFARMWIFAVCRSIAPTKPGSRTLAMRR